MSSIVISGDTSGSVTLTAPAVAGTNTATLPASTGNVVLDTATQTLTNKTLTSPTINGPTITMGGSVITSGTTVPTTSGTIVSLATGLPSWIKRVTLAFNGVVCAGTSPFIVQLGTGATPTYVTTGYTGGGFRTSASTTSETVITAGFGITHGAAGYTLNGLMTIVYLGSNIYTESFSGFSTGSNAGLGGGSYVDAGGVITALRLTTVDGLSSYSAGSITVLYE